MVPARRLWFVIIHENLRSSIHLFHLLVTVALIDLPPHRPGNSDQFFSCGRKWIHAGLSWTRAITHGTCKSLMILLRGITFRPSRFTTEASPRICTFSKTLSILLPPYLRPALQTGAGHKSGPATRHPDNYALPSPPAHFLTPKCAHRTIPLPIIQSQTGARRWDAFFSTTSASPRITRPPAHPATSRRMDFRIPEGSASDFSGARPAAIPWA